MKYDVFISYKRDEGSVWAELIRAILVHKYHLKVFLDVEIMHGGKWTEQLNDAIKNSCNILMVLFKGLGSKIKSDNDVFVQEIKHAKEYEKPIIPFYALGCDSSDIIKSKVVPSIIKDIVLEQHGIVKYDHENREKTYDLLRKQLAVKLNLKVSSLNGSCYMSYQINKELPVPTKEIKKDSSYIINLDRDFIGEIHLYLYAKEFQIKTERIIYVGKNIDTDIPRTINCEHYCWLAEKEEELLINMSVDWLLIQMDNLMNQSYNLTQAALGTFYSYFNKENV